MTMLRPSTAASRLSEFLRLEAAGGIVLMVAAVLAMIVANSPLRDAYEALLAIPFEIRFGAQEIAKPLILWINDGLMAVFFLLVGLELKAEVLDGHLNSVRSAALPFFAAVGGMGAPALIYTAFNRGDPVAMGGWAVASATDIAFALGILSLLGPKVPTALKAFLLSVAIFDDLGAILVIAFVYTENLSVTALLVAAGATVALAIMNRMGVRKLPGYFLIGAVMWHAVLKSGVHATLAGVVLAMFIPAGPDEGTERGAGQSPMHALEHALHPWVAFGILPVFAFANAGVPVLGLEPDSLLRPVPLGIAAGLVFGNLIGVSGMSFLAVQLRVASLPKGVRWRELIAVSLLCGVGFTMSLFIASLAFEGGGLAYPGVDRIGILAGSLVAGIAGYAALRVVLSDRSESTGG